MLTLLPVKLALKRKNAQSPNEADKRAQLVYNGTEH